MLEKMNDKILRTVVLGAVCCLCSSALCGDEKTLAEPIVTDVREKCETWCATHKIGLTFIVEESIDAQLSPFEIEQNGKKIKLPGQQVVLRASLMALSEWASAAGVTEFNNTVKNGEIESSVVKGGLSFGDLTVQSILTNSEKDESEFISISLKKHDAVILEYKQVSDKEEPKFTSAVKTYQELDDLLKKNGLKMRILFAAFNKENAAFVFVFDPVKK